MLRFAQDDKGEEDDRWRGAFRPMNRRCARYTAPTTPSMFLCQTRFCATCP